MYPHTHSSRTAAGSCGRSKTTPNALLLARTPVSSCKRPYKASVQHWSQQLRPSVIAKAQPGPDKGSVAALEAALGAINNILGTYNKVKGGKAGSGSKRGGSSSKGGSQAGAAVSTGPSKLVSFSAKASSSVPVKVSLKPVYVHRSPTHLRTSHAETTQLQYPMFRPCGRSPSMLDLAACCIV